MIHHSIVRGLQHHRQQLRRFVKSNLEALRLATWYFQIKIFWCQTGRLRDALTAESCISSSNSRQAGYKRARAHSGETHQSRQCDQIAIGRYTDAVRISKGPDCTRSLWRLPVTSGTLVIQCD